MSSTIRLDRWRTTASRLPHKKLGRAKVGWHTYKEGLYEAYGTGPPGESYTFFEFTRDIRITNLLIDGKVWMVDDCPHVWAIAEHATAYHGRVLVAGLGLGLIIHALQSIDAVESITVVEREQDVIDLVSPHMPRGKPLEIFCLERFGPVPIRIHGYRHEELRAMAELAVHAEPQHAQYLMRQEQ
jgi:hypothetical protein